MASPTSTTPTIAMPTPVPPNPLTTSPGTTGLRVRLFAGLREAAGWDERLVDLAATARGANPAGTTPEQLWRQLGLQPATPPDGMRVAINRQFATWDANLVAGDELAFLPPISGG